MPICKDCNIEKDSSLFWKQNPKQCKSCQNIYSKKWKENNKEHCQEVYKQYRIKNKERIAEKQRLRRKEKAEEMNKITSLWKKNNPDKVRASWAAFRAHRNKASPKWRNTFFIEEVYNLARKRTEITDIEWHVDHIIPLRGKHVCGLHVENNLQIVPKIVNLKKSNSFILE